MRTLRKHPAQSAPKDQLALAAYITLSTGFLLALGFVAILVAVHFATWLLWM